MAKQCRRSGVQRMSSDCTRDACERAECAGEAASSDHKYQQRRSLLVELLSRRQQIRLFTSQQNVNDKASAHVTINSKTEMEARVDGKKPRLLQRANRDTRENKQRPERMRGKQALCVSVVLPSPASPRAECALRTLHRDDERNNEVISRQAHSAKEDIERREERRPQQFSMKAESTKHSRNVQRQSNAATKALRCNQIRSHLQKTAVRFSGAH
jgi:hypothetical protein